MHYHYVNANKIILGCYEKAISYSYLDGESRIPIPMSQIESLIQLSKSCVQDIQYDCTLAPLALDGIDFAFWEDRTGEINNYFTGIILILLLQCNHSKSSISEGSNYGFHVCDCHYETEGCIEEETRYNTCNCDANLPITQTDTGTITNTSALPVIKLFFGGMNYELQYATFKLGRLKCHGTKEFS